MPTLNVCVQIYMNKKNTKNVLKLQIFIFFSEALSMYTYIHTYIHIYIHIYIYTHIYIYIYIDR